MKKFFLVLIGMMFLAGCSPADDEPTVEDPKIRLYGDATVHLGYNEDFEDPGAYVIGEGEYEIHVGGDVVDNLVPDNYFITYSFEYEGQIKSITRNVVVHDEIIVEFYLLGDEHVVINLGDSYRDEGYVLSDTSYAILLEDNVDMNTPGVYEINFSIIVNFEKVTITRTLEIVDLAAVIDFYLLGEMEMTINQGDEFIDPGYFINDETITVIVEGEVDVNTPGVYLVTYYYTKGATVIITRTVTVVDNTEI